MKKKQGAIYPILFLFIASLLSCARPPQTVLSANISSSSLVEGSNTVIHVNVNNTSKETWQNYKLLISYIVDNDQSIEQIAELPLSVSAGQTFEQNIDWFINFQPVEGLNYQVNLSLFSDDNTPLTEISIPIQFVQPAITISVNPTQLTQGEQAIINLQVSNPSKVEMQDYVLRVSYGEKNMDGYMIQDLPINVKAGETFNQNITWTAIYVPYTRNYEIRAILLKKDSGIDIYSISPIKLNAP